MRRADIRSATHYNAEHNDAHTCDEKKYFVPTGWEPEKWQNRHKSACKHNKRIKRHTAEYITLLFCAARSFEVFKPLLVCCILVRESVLVSAHNSLHISFGLCAGKIRGEMFSHCFCNKRSYFLGIKLAGEVLPHKPAPYNLRINFFVLSGDREY